MRKLFHDKRVVCLLVTFLLISGFANDLSSQTTLIDEDFTSVASGNFTTSTSSYPYQIDNNTNCTGDDGWKNITTNGSSSSTCTACTGNRAVIDYGSSSCDQDATLVVGSFIGTSSINISFDYAFNFDGSPEIFEVILYNKTTSSVDQTLVSENSDVNNGNYDNSGSPLSLSSDEFEIRVHYIGDYGWGAQFDNLLVESNCTTPSIGTATVDDTDCNMGTFDVSLEVTAAGEGGSVDVTDGMGNSETVTTFPTTVTFTGYAGGTSVTMNADNGSCDIDANTVTEDCSCTTPPTGTAAIDDSSCGSGQFHVDVTVSSIGDAAAVTISDGTTTDNNGGAGYGNGAVVQMGPYAAGTSVTITIAGLTWTSCSVDLAPVTEDCVCDTAPTATVSTSNLDCSLNTYDILVTVDSDGSGDANMTDILVDGVVEQANATTGNQYTISGVAIGSHTVTLEAEGSSFTSCTSIDYDVDETCNGGDACADAVDILNSPSTCDLTVATNENVSGLVPCNESMGNGNSMSKGDCSGDGCFEHSAYWYTQYNDLWYVIDIPDGSDEFSVHFTGLTCAVAVFPYTGACGSLSLMSITGGVGTGLADSDNDGNVETAANDNPLISTDGVIHFKGSEVATASTAPIYLRVFAHDDKASGTACDPNDIVNCSFTIEVTSPQANDVCGNAIDITTNNGGASSIGDLSVANAEGTGNEDETECGGSPDLDKDLWYEINVPNAATASEKFNVEFTVDGGNTGDVVVAKLYGLGCFGSLQDCEEMTFASSVSTDFEGAELNRNSQYYIQLMPKTGTLDNITVSAVVSPLNNTCDYFNSTLPAYELDNSSSAIDMTFATDTDGNGMKELWYKIDHDQNQSIEISIDDAGNWSDGEVSLSLYEYNPLVTNKIDCDNPVQHCSSMTGIDDFDLESGVTFYLGTSDYLLKIEETTADSGGDQLSGTLTGTTSSNVLADNASCDDPIDITGSSATGEDFDEAQISCDGNDKCLYYQVTLPAANCPNTSSSLETSTVITAFDFTFSNAATSGGVDGFAYISLFDSDCSTQIGSTVTASAGDGESDVKSFSGLTQGQDYFVRVCEYISNTPVDYDVSATLTDASPCNDDPDNAYDLSAGCFTYTDLDTWSAQGATHTSPVDGAGENDVWFSFTAPTGNGGSYTTTKSWATVFFENVSGHKLYLDLYNTTSTSPINTTYETGTSAGDQGWGIFGNLNEGQTYYLRLYHKELASVNVQYKIAVTDGPGEEPGWACGENTGSNISGCASGCDDLRETWFKIDLPDGTPGNMYWMIEVTGTDQDLDFELRSKYLNGNTSYVSCSGPEGGLEGACADFDHPCSSTALEGAVSIESTTTGLTGCDGNDSLGDLDPASTSQGSDGNTDAGSGVQRVYFNMNGAASGQKDYYYLRVFIDPSDPRYNDWAEVKICDIAFKGPYTTQALAEAGGTPDGGDCMCGISNVVVSDDNTCDGDDATFTVTYDVDGGSGNYEVYATADNTDLGITTGDVLATVTGVSDGTGNTIDVTISGPTSGTSISIDVRDTDMNSCNGGSPRSVDIATCPNTTVATDDFNHTPEGMAVTGSVLTNDYDPQGNPQTVNTTLVTDPTNGSVTIDASGNYTYTPTGSYTGEDSFTYEVCDDQTPQVCDQATVYIEVIPDPISGNEPPIANPDNVTTEVGVPVTASMISNDNDPDGDDLLVNTTPVTGPTNGTVTINSDGTYTYTPNGGFTGVDMFEYKVCDDPTEANCDITTVTIEVVDDIANITSAVDDSGVGLPNEDIVGDLITNDFDAEGDEITINTTPVSSPSNGSVVINGDGTYTYTPNADFVGNDEFVYEICDDGSPQACDEATVYLSILPELPNTTSAVNDFNHTPMDTAVDGNVLNNDYDIEGENQSIVNTTPVTAPTKGSVTLNTDGSYTYTPNSGETGEDFFVYEVCDDHGTDQACETATVYIEIIPDPNTTNNPPIANTDYSLTKKNTPIAGNMEGNDNDPDGDPLTVNTTPETNPTNGSVTILPDGSYIYTPNVGFVGSDMFEYEVCDDGSPALCDITTVFIDVIDDPGNVTAATDDSGVGIVNESILGNLLDNDTDPEGDNQTINTTPTSSPTNGSVTIYSNGLYEYTPNADFVGNDEFTYEVCDDGMPSKCTEATVYITVLPDKASVELTVQFTADVYSYAVGDINEGYYTYQNTGSGSTSGEVKIIISYPSTSSFTTTFNAAATTTTVGGGTALDNDDWNFTNTPTGVIAILKSNVSIPAGGNSKIGGLSFEAVGVPLSTAKTTSQILEGTGGDEEDNNNRAQGTFIIN